MAWDRDTSRFSRATTPLRRRPRPHRTSDHDRIDADPARSRTGTGPIDGAGRRR